MSRSSLLRAVDVRAVFQIVGECRELGDGPIGWRRHLLAEAARLAGAAVANEYEGVFQPFRPTVAIAWGYEKSGFDRSIFDRVNEELIRRGPEFLPMMSAFFAAQAAGRGPCLTRGDVLADSLWYQSRYYQDYHATSGADAMMYCMLPQTNWDGVMSGLVLLRPLHERDFSARSRALVRELHEQITALIGGPLAAFHEPSPATLPPRVRQTLQCLLEGDSDKQIATRLGLSRLTVNQYTKVIFAHFGVNGRAELLARWIRRGWGNKCAWLNQPAEANDGQPSANGRRRRR